MRPTASWEDVAERTRNLHPPAVVSYREVRDLAVGLARLEQKMDQVIALAPRVDALEDRIVELEKANIAAGARGGFALRLVDYALIILGTITAAGIWVA